MGFPGGAVVKNPPANAGDTGLSPGLGRSNIPRNNKAREPQLLKPTHLEPMLPTRGATAMRSLRTTTKSSPRSLQPEKSLRAVTKTRCSQK